MAKTACIARLQPNQVFEAPGSRAGHVAQGLVRRFTSAFEETKRELEGVTNDLEHSFSLQLATKLKSEELPQKLQEASLVSRASLQAHVKQVSLVLHLCAGTYTSAFWHADVLANVICIGADSCVTDMQICYVIIGLHSCNKSLGWTWQNPIILCDIV